jgi:hypothetical protein
MERLRRALEPSRCAYARPLRTLDGPHEGPEKDFDLDLSQIAILKFRHLVESLLANRSLGLLKSFVLTLDDCPAHRTLALFIAFQASFKRHVEEDQSGRDLGLPGQVEQIFPCLTGQRRGVHHAQPVHYKPLFYKEMHQRKGLCVEALVTFVVADESARPIRRNDLRGPKVPLGKCGFSASRRSA